MSSQTIAPLPKTGLPAGVQTGALGKRLVAQLLDLVVPGVGVAVAVAAGGTVAVVLGIVVTLAWLLLMWWMGAKRAATPGMRLMKIQVVGLRDGRPIGWGRFAVRELVLLALTVTVVGLLVMLYLLVRQPRHQGWPDLLAETVVIKERPLAPPQARAQADRPAPPAVSNAARPAPAPAASSATKAALAPLTPPGAQPAPSRQPVSSRQPAPARPSPQSPTSPPEPAARPTPLTPPVPSAQPVRSPQPVSAQSAPAGSSAVAAAQPKVGPRPVVTIASPQEPEPAARPTTAASRVVLDDGRTLEVTGLVLLGRNPQPRAGEESAELVKVADETRTVSKTHLALGVDARGIYVVDRGSTNGSTVTDTSGVSRLCMAGEVVRVADGNIVSFGEHWLRVEHQRSS